MPRGKKTGPRQQAVREELETVTPPVTRCCGHCDAWAPDKDPEKPGTCHRRSPTTAIRLTDLGSLRWPETAYNEFCLDFVASPNPPPPPFTPTEPTEPAEPAGEAVG